MGALTGALTLRRYRVLGSLPDGWREQFHKSIRAHALVPIDPAGREDKSVGWCSMMDEQRTDLNFEDWYGHMRILLSLRVDTLRVDKDQLRRVLKERQKEIEAECQEPLSAGALRDLKAILAAELRQKTAPKTRTVDMVWDLDAGVVLFYAHSKGMNEAFLTLFSQTFNLPLDLDGPGAWAKDLAAHETLKDAKPTPELIDGFLGLRPGPVSELDCGVW